MSWREKISWLGQDCGGKVKVQTSLHNGNMGQTWQTNYYIRKWACDRGSIRDSRWNLLIQGPHTVRTLAYWVHLQSIAVDNTTALHVIQFLAANCFVDNVLCASICWKMVQLSLIFFWFTRLLTESHSFIAKTITLTQTKETAKYIGIVQNIMSSIAQESPSLHPPDQTLFLLFITLCWDGDGGEAADCMEDVPTCVLFSAGCSAWSSSWGISKAT